MNRLIKRSFLIYCAVLVFSFAASAQTAKTNFTRSSPYDVQHYIIRVSFNHPERKVFGDTTVQLKSAAGSIKEVELDAVGMKFESVKLEPENKDLQFRTTDSKVIVTLDKAYTPENLISLRFKYTATPKKGLYFVDEMRPEEGIPTPAQIWTQGEPDEARHWIPSFDFPSDKATSEQIVTVPKGQIVIGNGELVEEKQDADGTTTFHYKMNVPHTIYLTSLVVGNYVKISDKYKEIPLSYYVYAGREAIVPKAYGGTKDMMRVFEELTGVDYPYNKYDQTIVANFQFGGMENITATTMADQEIFFAELNPRIVGDLVSHELAHSWFGNMVTCKNWAELWLNEGFATFMEAAYREKMYGREDYNWKIATDARAFMAFDTASNRKHGLYNQLAGDVDKLFDTAAVTYNKGGAVLHTLRETIGDEAFWKGVNLYLNEHKFKSVETPDLQKAMETASGQKLEWFFKQWVYGIGYPKLEATQIWDARTKTLKLTVNQTQKADDLTPAAFTLPMELEIDGADGKGTAKIEKIELKSRTQTFSFKLKNKPVEIFFDKANKIPLKTVKISPLK